MEKVTFVGMGTLGILYGNAFAKALGEKQVCFLAEGDRLRRYWTEGAFCNGEKCSFRYSDGTDCGEAELLIFAVKGPALQEAIKLATPCVGEDTVILSLLNGVTSEEILGQAFGPDKILYTITQGMDAVREGNRLTYTHAGDVFLGIPAEDYFDREEKLEETMALFQKAGISVHREEDILHRLWCKFMMNVGVNQVCMAYDCPYGGIQKPGELRDMVIAAMNEARKVGACQGVLVTQKDLQEYLGILDRLNPEASPSMRQDSLAHRKTEVDLFAGAVVEMAGFFGMSVPVNQSLLEIITEMEKSW